MPFRYPVALELEGRRCVVIGGGEIGEHKARSLLVAGADVVVVSETFTEGLRSLGRRGELELVHKTYSYGDLEGAFLAIAATDDVAVNSEIYKEAEERNVLLNAVDDVEHCHFAVPSIVRRGEFLLAISTGGKAPALAKRLRAELTDAYGPEYGALVELLGEVREETIATVRPELSFEAWAHRWQRALDADLLRLLQDGRAKEAREIVRRAVGAEGVERRGDRSQRSRVEGRTDPAAGRVSIVGAGPGDPGLITVRGRELLEICDVVVHDRLVHPVLLEGKETIDVGKEAGDHPVPQTEINELLVALARTGKHVVRLKGGDPFVFGRGAEEAEALADAGVPFEVVSGPTSAVAALASAGIPLTDRRAGSSVAFVTGHCGGEAIDWERLARTVDTIVVFMGLGGLDEIARRLIAGGRAPDESAAVVSRGTLPDEQIVVAPLAELPRATIDAGVRPPALVVVGDVVRLQGRIASPPGERVPLTRTR